MSLTRRAMVFSLALCCGGFYLRADAQIRPKKQIPTGTIAGKVTIKGKAAPGILVALRSSIPNSAFEPVFKATTDQDGRYRVIDVPAGSYQVAPVAPALVISGFSNLRGVTVVLTEGEAVDGIDFALVQGGVITGKVTDAEGRPVVEQRVNLVSADLQQNPSVTIYSMGTSSTDDRGVYRMFGLVAGRYKVFVGESDDFFMNVSGGRPAYKQTFYPDVTDESKASVVEVSEGSEASNIDITLGRATQTFAVSGRVVESESSKPVPNVRFGLQLIIGDRRNSFSAGNTSSNGQGEFRIENLPPGKYGIFVLPQRDRDLRSDAVVVDIVDQDVDGLVMKATNGASLAGRITLENPTDKAAFAKLPQLRLQVFVRTADLIGGFGQTATVNSDGSFRIGGLQSGVANVSLGAQDRSLLKGFTISRIERDQVVQLRGIEIRPEEQITGLQVILSYGSATVHGVVKLVNGALPVGSRIFVRVSKPGETTSSRIQSPQVDSRGHFILEGLAGGTYDFVVTVGGPMTVREPTTKQQVTVVDGVVNDLAITLDLNPNADTPSPK